MLKKFCYIATGMLLVLLASGCAAKLTPMQVSEKFWEAVKNKDTNAARHFVTEDARNRDLTENILPLEEVTLGRTVIDGEQAWVDTTVVISADKPFTLPLKTVLLQENERWKVDYDATVASVSKGSHAARVISGISDLSRQFTEELNRSMDDIQRSLPQLQKELEKLENNLREKLPELRQQMQEFLRQLEEALGQDKPAEPPPSSTTEI
ncbi:MAG TPA: hypothetical protein VLN56_04195 [Gammaproteobacteria bacterium]|nr:hypothetical protein [Gammaproteobacteria bacterium]